MEIVGKIKKEVRKITGLVNSSRQSSLEEKVTEEAAAKALGGFFFVIKYWPGAGKGPDIMSDEATQDRRDLGL